METFDSDYVVVCSHFCGRINAMLKLTYRHINRQHFLNIKYISLHQLIIWLNAMLDFIGMGFAELWASGSKWNSKWKNICLHRESNQRSLAFQRGAYNY